MKGYYNKISDLAVEYLYKRYVISNQYVLVTPVINPLNRCVASVSHYAFETVLCSSS